MNTHPLAQRLHHAAHGVFPPADGVVEVVPSPGPPCDAIVGFTGHFVVAGDLDERAVAARMPPGDFSVPFSPGSLQWLSGELGLEPATYDALLVTIGDGAGAPAWLRRADDLEHPRVDRASRYREVESIWSAADDAGVLIVGRGLCGRWEVGFVPVAAEVLFTRGH